MSAGVQLVLELGPLEVTYARRRNASVRRGDLAERLAAFDAARGVRRLYHFEAATNPGRRAAARERDFWRPVVTVYPGGAMAVAL